MYMGRAHLRNNSPARLPLLCTYRLHVCPHVGYVRDTHGKDSCWIVTLASGGAVHRGEQAVVSSAAISIKDSKPKPAEIIRQ